jgi:phenylacetate-coenzyme A ligase PaaK-like adenylate-forming protein
VAPIRHYQFVQTHLDRLEVRLESARPLHDQEARRVIEWAHAKFGNALRIELVYPATLPRSAAGKFEDFVCLL